jgi:hypothetical protein
MGRHHATGGEAMSIAPTTLDTIRRFNGTVWRVSLPAWRTREGRDVAPMVDYFMSRVAALRTAASWDAVAPAECPAADVVSMPARKVPLPLQR